MKNPLDLFWLQSGGCGGCGVSMPCAATADFPAMRATGGVNLCKGPQAPADRHTRLRSGDGACTRGGRVCMRCTEPGFRDPGHASHVTPRLAGIAIGRPTDVAKAWFVALASLPRRVKHKASADPLVVASVLCKTRST